MPTIDPLRGSKAHVGELLDRSETAEALFTALTRECLGQCCYRVEAWHRSRSSRVARPRPRSPSRTAPETDVAERKEALDSDVDDLLDEIDDVLETNAEDFVKSFIQKGGE